MAVAALCVILITPFAAGQATIVMTPLTFITIAGMYAAIIDLSWKSQQELRDHAKGMTTPYWVNECLDESLELDVDHIPKPQNPMNVI